MRAFVALLGVLVLLSVNAAAAAALQQKLPVAGGVLAGFSVAVDGDTLVVGDPGDTNGKGALTFVQKLAGRRAKAGCVAPTRANPHQPACERRVGAATLSIAGHRGPDRLAFEGLISPSKTLRPGRYTLLITAINVAGQRSAQRSLSFTIAR